MALGELGQTCGAAAQLLGRQRRWFAHRGGLQVDREVVGQVGLQPSGSVGARQPGDGAQQRPIVVGGLRHLVVEAFVILPFDSIGAESDSLADQNARACLRVVVGEQGMRHCDREPR